MPSEKPVLTLTSVDRFDARQQRESQRALDTLDRLDGRLDAVYSKNRRHDRKQFRSIVRVCLPDDLGNLTTTSPHSCQVWGRSISAGGLSFIHPEPINESRILVGLPMGDGESTWFQAEIVRTREVPDTDFWEHGIAFRGRVACRGA